MGVFDGIATTRNCLLWLPDRGGLVQVKALWDGLTEKRRWVYDLDLLSALPSGWDYQGSGGGVWVAGTGVPKWQAATTNVARFILDPTDATPLGVAFEHGVTNYAGYNRGTTRTGWVATGITPAAVEGCDQTGTKALRLTATADGGTYEKTGSLPTAAGAYCFSARARRVTGIGPVKLYIVHDSAQRTEVDISAFLLPNDTDPAAPFYYIRGFCGDWYGASAIEGFGIEIAESGDVVDFDFAQLELCPNGWIMPTSEISTEGVASATRAADKLIIQDWTDTAHRYLLDADAWAAADETDTAWPWLTAWRARRERHLRSITIVPTGTADEYDVTIATPPEWQAGRRFNPGAPSPIVIEHDPETDTYDRGAIIDAGYDLTAQTFGAVSFGASNLFLRESGATWSWESGADRLLEA